MRVPKNNGSGSRGTHFKGSISGASGRSESVAERQDVKRSYITYNNNTFCLHRQKESGRAELYHHCISETGATEFFYTI